MAWAHHGHILGLNSLVGRSAQSGIMPSLVRGGSRDMSVAWNIRWGETPVLGSPDAILRSDLSGFGAQRPPALTDL